MNKKRRIITIIVALSMFCMMSMSALADGWNVHIYLPENQEWTSGGSILRSGKYSYVMACCDSVYPTIGTDNYTKIQARLVDSSGERIMLDDCVILKEGSGYKHLYIMEGYQNLGTIYIQFRGNTNAGAEAVVSFYSL